jgi:hypothetical protein
MRGFSNFLAGFFVAALFFVGMQVSAQQVAGCPTPTPIPTLKTGEVRPTASLGIGDRANPVPLGTSIRVVNGDGFEYVLAIGEVLRGESALRLAQNWNKSNKVPVDPTKELLIVSIEYEILKGPSGKNLRFSNVNDFKTISNNQVMNYAEIYNPDFNVAGLEVFSGAKGKFYQPLIVFKNDPAPLISHNTKYDGSGGVYFSTK